MWGRGLNAARNAAHASDMALTMTSVTSGFDELIGLRYEPPHVVLKNYQSNLYCVMIKHYQFGVVS